MGGAAGQPGGHVDFFRINREMHQRALFEFKDFLPRVAVVPVLANGIRRGGATERIFQFQSHQRHTVQAQRDIEGLARLGAEKELPGDAQAVRGIAGFKIGIQPVGGFEIGDPQGSAVAFEAMPQGR